MLFRTPTRRKSTDLQCGQWARDTTYSSAILRPVLGRGAASAAYLGRSFRLLASRAASICSGVLTSGSEVFPFILARVT